MMCVMVGIMLVSVGGDSIGGIIELVLLVL